MGDNLGINAQMKESEASEENSLGRLIKIYEDNKDQDQSFHEDAIW